MARAVLLLDSVAVLQCCLRPVCVFCIRRCLHLATSTAGLIGDTFEAFPEVVVSCRVLSRLVVADTASESVSVSLCCSFRCASALPLLVRCTVLVQSFPECLVAQNSFAKELGAGGKNVQQNQNRCSLQQHESFVHIDYY